MAESISTQPVTTRLAPVCVDVVERLAARDGCTRSTFIARAVDRAVRDGLSQKREALAA